MRIKTQSVTLTQPEGFSRNFNFNVSGKDKHKLFADVLKQSLISELERWPHDIRLHPFIALGAGNHLVIIARRTARPHKGSAFVLSYERHRVGVAIFAKQLANG